jgi:membrane associated rhomboid family serine protease
MSKYTKLLIQINITIFFLWFLLDAQIMIDHFLVSTNAIVNGRVWTVITSVFSHNMPLHLLLNMLILYNFGLVLEGYLGGKRFLWLYMLSGLSGSLMHCLSSSLLIHDPTLQALGASGAISGLLVFFSLQFPKHLVYLFGLIPIPSLIATLSFIGLDLYGLIKQSHGAGLPIGHGAHLGGALMGGIYFFFIWRRRRIIYY